jgi:assimilatory nitrate reductase catalytic subunit
LMRKLPPTMPQVSERTSISTHCPYCAFQCGMNLTGPRKQEQATVAGNEAFPVNKGALCIKGWTSIETLAHPDRLLTPLARNPEGDLKPVTWDEALTRTVSAFQNA